MRLEVIVDGELVELPPRRAEMVRQLVKASLDLDTMEVGEVRFRLSYEKVTQQVVSSRPPVRVLGWREWWSALANTKGS
jgi:hypothetical protein